MSFEKLASGKISEKQYRSAERIHQFFLEKRADIEQEISQAALQTAMDIVYDTKESPETIEKVAGFLSFFKSAPKEEFLVAGEKILRENPLGIEHNLIHNALVRESEALKSAQAVADIRKLESVFNHIKEMEGNAISGMTVSDAFKKHKMEDVLHLIPEQGHKLPFDVIEGTVLDKRRIKFLDESNKIVQDAHAAANKLMKARQGELFLQQTVNSNRFNRQITNALLGASIATPIVGGAASIIKKKMDKSRGFNGLMKLHGESLLHAASQYQDLYPGKSPQEKVKMTYDSVYALSPALASSPMYMRTVIMDSLNNQASVSTAKALSDIQKNSIPHPGASQFGGSFTPESLSRITGTVQKLNAPMPDAELNIIYNGNMGSDIPLQDAITAIDEDSLIRQQMLRNKFDMPRTADPADGGFDADDITVGDSGYLTTLYDIQDDKQKSPAHQIYDKYRSDIKGTKDALHSVWGSHDSVKEK